MFDNDEDIQNYFVYQYHHLDDLSAALKPEKAYGVNSSKKKKQKVKDTINRIANLFLANGWEGDGEISLIWIPPFIDIGLDEDTSGYYLWYVKQANNGTSFIASPFQLRLKRLQDQNNDISINEYRNMDAVNIIQIDTDGFIARLKTKKDSFEKEIAKLKKESDDEVSIKILTKILGYTQCDLIAELNEYMDGCYLRLLDEVLQRGNKSNIKIRKSAIKIDLAKNSYDGEDMTEEGLNWLSVNMFMSEIWRSYKFEPFDEKYNRLTKSVDYKAQQELRDFLFKHIIIRNCIQHHDWQLDPTSLKTVGKEKIEIATENKPIQIAQWQQIQLTYNELDLLFEQLLSFAIDFNSYIDKRVNTRWYRSRKTND